MSLRSIREGLVNRSEPLRCSAEDHRRLGTPAVRVLVSDGAFAQQRARGDQFRNYRSVGVTIFAGRREDALARKDRDVRQEGTVFADQSRDFQTMRAGQLEIVFAMRRRRVHETGAGIGGDMRRFQQRHREIIALAMKRMMANPVARIHIHDQVQRASGIARASASRRADAITDAFTANRKAAFLRRFDCVEGVFEVFRIGDGAICGNRPGRCGPDDDGNLRGLRCRVRGKMCAFGPERKFDIDLRRRFLVIFDFRFGQRGFLDR